MPTHQAQSGLPAAAAAVACRSGVAAGTASADRSDMIASPSEAARRTS